MIGTEALRALIPHQGGMCLLDDVAAWDATSIHAIAQSHRDPVNPLRRDGQLAALHLCEYGAQAMAVHGGLLASAEGGRARPGLLVSLRAVELARDRVEDCEGALDVHAQMLHADTSGWQYAFRIEHRGATLASGRAAVMLRGDGP